MFSFVCLSISLNGSISSIIYFFTGLRQRFMWLSVAETLPLGASCLLMSPSSHSKASCRYIISRWATCLYVQEKNIHRAPDASCVQTQSSLPPQPRLPPPGTPTSPQLRLLLVCSVGAEKQEARECRPSFTELRVTFFADAFAAVKSSSFHDKCVICGFAWTFSVRTRAAASESFPRAPGSRGERRDFCRFGPLCLPRLRQPPLRTLIESHKESNGLELVCAARAMRAQPGVDGSRLTAKLLLKVEAPFTRRWKLLKSSFFSETALEKKKKRKMRTHEAVFKNVPVYTEALRTTRQRDLSVTAGRLWV